MADGESSSARRGGLNIYDRSSLFPDRRAGL